MRWSLRLERERLALVLPDRRKLSDIERVGERCLTRTRANQSTGVTVVVVWRCINLSIVHIHVSTVIMIVSTVQCAAVRSYPRHNVQQEVCWVPSARTHLLMVCGEELRGVLGCTVVNQFALEST